MTTHPSLSEIVKATASRMNGVTVDINRSMATVAISDDEGEHEDIFLQGDEASTFIDTVDKLYVDTGDLPEDECALSVAHPFVENIWN